MKINEIHILPPAAALVATVFPADLQALDYALTAADGSTFSNRIFLTKSVAAGLRGGHARNQPIVVTRKQRHPGGYVNVVLDGNWVMRLAAATSIGIKPRGWVVGISVKRQNFVSIIFTYYRGPVPRTFISI